MDKRKAIAAYRLGLISAQECAQILGLDNPMLLGCCLPGGMTAAHAAAPPSEWREAAFGGDDPEQERRKLILSES
ncbi:hypothetical protein [Cohnella nanjingensis]|uniref:Uncharacterized protein n=1 Tax=Cohnella nanjingensis TaxID=1387779 RepID=A0A7X0VI40_9BACL|nr:hypothetical protein [Cohnella nanjingensis]MBB6674138.1 hypothetical protein [Cohnella nanjingensis]